MFLSIEETIVVRLLLICGVPTYCSVCGCVCVCVCVCFDSQTYAQGHTSSVIQGGGKLRGGGRLMEPLPRVFDVLQYFETIFPSVESH